MTHVILLQEISSLSYLLAKVQSLLQSLLSLSIFLLFIGKTKTLTLYT